MGELTARVQQVTNIAEKAIVEQASNVEAAVGEVNKLQAEGVAKVGQVADKVQSQVQNLAQVAREKYALTLKITGEWGKQVGAATNVWAKQVVEATRTAAQAFTAKA